MTEALTYTLWESPIPPIRVSTYADSSGSSPVVATIPRRFWQSNTISRKSTPLDEDLTRRRYATWNIEYRRVGEDGGGWPGTFDVIDAVNRLTQLEERFQLRSLSGSYPWPFSRRSIGSLVGVPN